MSERFLRPSRMPRLVSRLVPVLASVLAMSLAQDAHACAACRNPTMPVSNVGSSALEAGSVRLGLTFTGTTVRVVHEAGCEDLATCSEVPIQPLHHHDQRLTPIEARLQGEYSISDVWGVELQVPLRTVFAQVKYETPDGASYEPLDEGVHHRDEVLFGLGDPWLLGRAQFGLGDIDFILRAGVSLPFGHTEENPFELGDRGEEHQHVQMGTGTFDPIASVDVERRWRRLFLRGYVLGTAALYENHHGFRSPLRTQGGAYGGALWEAGTSAEAGLELMHETPERWDGDVEQDGSLGRTELLAGIGIAQALGHTSLLLAARFPLVRVIRTGEEAALIYRSPFVLTVGVAHTF